MRVSTWGRGGGAQLQCVRVGVPTQDRVSEDQCTGQEGTCFAGVLLSQITKMQELPCLRSCPQD